MMRSTGSPAISVVVPTRNRPDAMRRCLESLAAVRYPDWEILLVDQSDDESTHDLAGGFTSAFPRLVYHRLNEVGAARARNFALTFATSEIVAFLDDDCTVDAGWLAAVATTFERYPDVALVFGRVVSADHDWSLGLIPVHELVQERVRHGRLAFLGVRGMAASMYIRRSCWPRMGPVDVNTGAGARFAGEDRDLCYRVLAAGLEVVETPAIVVCHHGIRDYQSGAAARLIRRAAYSTGALHMKRLRCLDPVAVLLIVVEVWRDLKRINLSNIVRGRKPTGLAWIVMYSRGLFGSLRVPIDRRRGLFVS